MTQDLRPGNRLKLRRATVEPVTCTVLVARENGSFRVVWDSEPGKRGKKTEFPASARSGFTKLGDE